MKQLAWLWLPLLLLACAARAETYTFNQDRSHLDFTVHHFLGKVGGRFRQFNGTLQFNRQAVEKSAVSVTVDVASVDTANSDRDADLRSAKFFNVARFPTATFRSTSVRRVSGTETRVTGELTLHGVTRPLTLSVRSLDPPGSTSSSRVTHWQATAELDRGDYGLLWNPVIETSGAVGKGISFQISVEAFHP